MIKKPQTKKGFTIIEVVLVLAIAGLIFLMVFLAFPALQRAQKDTQRRDQMAMLVTQLTQYQANNRNRLPSCESGKSTESVEPSSGNQGSLNHLLASTNFNLSNLDDLIADEQTKNAGDNTGKGGCVVTATYGSNDKIDLSGSTAWVKFYKNYLLAQDTDLFEDPNGQPYSLQIETCSGNSNGSACSKQRTDANFNGTDATKDQEYRILLTYNSTCDGETIVYNTGARKITVAYKLEGGGTFCQGN